MKTLELFGTSGIRGTANVEITPDLARKLGETFASFFRNTGTIAVGRDVRLPAKLLQYAFTAGVLAGGVDVENYGLVPTPAVLWAVKKRGLDGAAVITGSHTPADIIGFLFFLNDTAEFSVQESYQFEKLFSSQPKSVPWNELGRCYKVDISELYLTSVLGCVDRQKLTSEFKMVIDPGNGASVICESIFRAAGVNVHVINGEPNGLFPSRDPYPRPENLGKLGRTVTACDADLGSATDADGDRAIFVTHEGNVLWGDVSGGIFVQNVLKKLGGGTVVTPINTSQLISWICNTSNGQIRYTKVGPPNIISTLKDVKAVFALEETGKNIWPDTILYGDWALTTLKMLEVMAAEHKPLSELAQDFPPFYLKKVAFPCREALKTAVLANVLKRWGAKHEIAEVITIDGVKILYPDGAWMLFRPSGTEPVFRLYVESRDRRKARELFKFGSEIMGKALSFVKN